MIALTIICSIIVKVEAKKESSKEPEDEGKVASVTEPPSLSIAARLDAPPERKLPPGVQWDFDAENWRDPYQVSNYAMDTFNYLKSREVCIRETFSFLSRKRENFSYSSIQFCHAALISNRRLHGHADMPLKMDEIAASRLDGRGPRVFRIEPRDPLSSC